MSPPDNPLAAVAPWNLVADGYAETTMLVLQRFAEQAIAAVGLNSGDIVLDVACGPGTLGLIAASTASKVRGIDFSEAMLAIFKQKSIEAGHDHIELHCGDAQTLPYADATFDAAFSLFGLMFFPDRKQGFAEIFRTLKPGGRIAVTSWAPMDQSPAMMTMFGALRAIKPELPQPQRSVTTLENPDVFRQEMIDAGFRNVEIRTLTQGFAITSIPEFWSFMVKGSAPLVMMKKAMGDEMWREKEKIALDYLAGALAEKQGEMTSDAWLGVGVK